MGILETILASSNHVLLFPVIGQFVTKRCHYLWGSGVYIKYSFHGISVAHDTGSHGYRVVIMGRLEGRVFSDPGPLVK